uniref:protein ANTAGONIST OF LIKE HETEROCHROMATIN PROTEIN 1-like n=1 Tax=Erigeron canadensis TaxID=72917 RepID=UPI001CB8FA0D|nr:protein ANTAGONIST OF LIKE HETEROCHROMATIN PROTEIN 1-like [Erigeron canadensis]
MTSSNTKQENSSDYFYYYSLLQQTFDQMNDAKPTTSGNDGEKQAQEQEEEQVKTKGLKEIITSLLLIEEQDKIEKQTWDDAQEQDKVMFQENHNKKTKAMLDYRNELQELDEVIDETHRVRKRKARAATNAALASVVISADADITSAQKNTPSTSTVGNTGAGGAGGPQRRLWVKTRSTDWWDKCNSPDFPEEEFKRAFRMGKDTFEMICNELTSVVAKENTMLRDAVPVRQRVAVCIWRLATGEPLRLVSKRFGLGISTCHKLVLEVCSAIKNVLMPKYLQWPNEDTIRVIKDEFVSISGIPNVIGSMYTTHIPIIAPKISVAAYFNKRHTERNQKTSYSITVQGVVDPRGVFTDVCIGWPGSMPDDQVLEKSALFQRANNGLLKDVWVVGSSGYPLMDWVLVPYTQPHLTWTQHAFNEKIGEIQRVAKDSFARLKGRWSCLQKRTEVKLQDLPVVLGACCVLHNICEIRNEEIEPELMIELMDDEMVPEIGLRSAIAMKARDSIAHNLLHHNHAGTSFLT